MTMDDTAALHARIADLETRLEAERPASRRHLLRLAGAAVAGGAAALVSSGQAHAAGELILSSTFNQMTSPTGTAAVSATPLAYGLGVTDNGLASVPVDVSGGAIFGHADAQAFGAGVVAYASAKDTTAFVGLAEGGSNGSARGMSLEVTGEGAEGIKVLASGTQSATGLRVTAESSGSGPVKGVDVSVNAGDAIIGVSDTGAGAVLGGGGGAIRFHSLAPGTPPSASTAYEARVLTADDDAALWYCTTGGTPGTWQKVAGPGTAGAFHAITPTRVYDSRSAAPTPGKLAGGASRPVSVKDGRDLATGAVNAADLVPAGATAVSVNVGITQTVGSGWLTINPGGVATIGASSINWSATGQTLANGIIAKINTSTRQLTVVAGGTGQTHFFLDITGYWR